MTLLFNPNSYIEVDVSYFDEAEEREFRNYPSVTEINDIIRKGVKIKPSEFLTYYLYHKKRLNHPDYRDYYAIGKRIGEALSALNGSIESNGHSFYSRVNPNTLEKGITQHIGDSIGLSVVNEIHKLIPFDWVEIEQPIGQVPVKIFDYKIQTASTLDGFIQVENKGACVSDNGSPNLSTHLGDKKNQIKGKKLVMKNMESKNNYPYPSTLKYGAVTAFDTRHNSHVKCLLVDPEPQKLYKDPRSFRLITRMRHISDCISLIAPRSDLAYALSQRLTYLESIDDIAKLDGLPLERRNGKSFDLTPYDNKNYSKYWTYRSHVADGPAGGVIVKISKNDLFFIGIRDELLDMAADQKFDEITKYTLPSFSMNKSIVSVLTKTKFHKLHLPLDLHNSNLESKNRISLISSGLLHYSSCGLILGVLPIDSTALMD